jgi:hypothetical protein
LIEPPNFREGLEEREKPLDLRLYFLQNGHEVDADALSSRLDVLAIRREWRVLKILAPNGIGVKRGN